MANITNIPVLLKNGNISAINDKMLSNNHSFVFLGKKEELLNRMPSTYSEAFEMYVNGLYKVYHELGMEFLKCYCNETIKNNYNNTFTLHIRFIEECRGAIQHLGDDGTRSSAFSKLKNYVFRNSAFQYSDWNDFWLNADENQWKKVTDIIVRDSNSLYYDLLDKVAMHDFSYKAVYEAVAYDFKNNVYAQCVISKGTVTNKKLVDMYDVSLSGRFFKLIRQQLINSNCFQSKDLQMAKEELWDLVNHNNYKDIRTEDEINEGKKTPIEIKENVINVIKNDLEGTNNFDFKSDNLYNDVVTEVERQIKNQISARRAAEYLSILK